MKFKIKKILSIICTVAMAGTLISCHRTDETLGVNIQFMHGWGDSKPIHESMRNIYSGFQTKNSDISVSFVTAPESSIIIDRAGDMLAVNKMADIVSTNGIASFVQYASVKDMALDLMPYIENDEELRGCIDSSVFAAWTNLDGTLYTIPDALEVMGYWYNEKILSDAGVTSIPKTWDEFWDMCEAIKLKSEESNSDISVFALEKEQVVANLLLALIAGSEEGLSMAYEMPDSFENPIIRKALGDVYKAYGYSRKIDRLEDARQAFREGKMAIYFNGLWECEEIVDGMPSSNIRYANYPTNSGKSLSYVSPASGYVLHKSGDPAREQASVEFLKYILSEEQQERILIETGQVPSNPQVNLEDVRESRPLLTSALEDARAADIKIKSIESVWNGSVIDLLKAKIESFVAGYITIDQLIEDLDRLVQGSKS